MTPNTSHGVETMSPELQQALARAKAHWDAMSPADRAVMMDAQRESWVRAFSPCEHGVLDWEECPKCREGIA